MRKSRILAFVSTRVLVTCAAALVGVMAANPRSATAQSLVAGQNVNMVGGPWSYDPATGRIVGDPFLQRQNEPSLAISSRNPCHLLGGANDYRAVDVPGLPSDKELGDAWLGVFKSIDCGHSWVSTLLPGYPQDRSAEGLASPLKGLQAAADATVRSGPGGILYYSGIAFNRGTNNIGKVFVARFLDRNNKEKGDPVQYAGAVQIDVGTSGQFLDKPWIAVDEPSGTATCTVDGETVPAAPVYLTYTSFVGSTSNPHSKIMFSKSADCGATWSNPSKLSESFALNQGTVMAVSPVDGSISIAWREFADPGLDPNLPTTVGAILFARSTDGGKSFSKAQAIDARVQPFDQGTSGVSFRTNAYPTMAIDGTGRIYVAWAARGFAAARPDVVSGDARIVVSTSGDGGATWTSPNIVVDEFGQPGHQVMPALALAAGKLMLVYYDFRNDISQTFGRYVNEAEAAQAAGLRHTVELRAAMAEPARLPVFTLQASVSDPDRQSTQVTRYLEGNYTKDGQRLLGVPLQYNPPNLPMFAQGTVPFIGDYLDVAGQTFVLNESGQWKFNTAADPSGRRQPVFHVAWSDNRDVRRPPAGQTWANYRSPTLGPNGLVCDPGSNPGSRNQNIYTAPLMPGLVVTSPGNQKTLGQIQRAFVVYARNTTDTDRYYQLTIAPTPAGSWGSFARIDETQLPSPTVLTQIGPIRIPRRSSISRTVFLASPGRAYPPISVQVAEVVGSGQTPAIAAVVLNPDISNPDISNPDISNPDISNPDISNAEVYNPDISNPDISNPDISNPDISNPDISNPDISNPDISNATAANPDISNPDISNPDISNPDISNPDISNPDISNPDVASSAIGNFNVTDVTWSIRNKGNTTAAYAFRARLARGLPAGAKLQLIVRRVYIAPQADSLNSCAPPVPAIQNQVLVNIPNPELNADLLASFDPRAFGDNASFFLAPSDQGRVTLRLFCPKGEAGCPATADAARALTAARVEAQAPNNCPPGSPFANCAVNGFRPDAIYDTTPPTTGCTVMVDGVSYDCANGPFYSKNPATVTLTPFDAVGVQQTTCSVDGQACSGLAFSVGGEGVHAVAYQSRDFSGNQETLQSLVVHIDATAPVVSGFSGFPVLGQWVSAPSVTGAVNVTDGSPVSLTCSDTRGGTTVSGLSITVAGDGSHQIACTVTDQAGNSSSASTTVNLDTGLPVVTVPAVVVTAEAAGPGGSGVTYGISATDALSGATVDCAPPSSSNFVLGETTVTCTARDGAGNTATATFVVTVRDTTPPSVTVPPAATAEATGGAGAAVSFAASASDSVSGARPVTCVPVSGSTFPLGTTSVVCSATDAAGNTGSAGFTVTVRDATAPVVTVPANMVVEATGPTGAAAAFTASASDSVSGARPATCVPVSGSTFPLGTTSVACSATDAAGNTGSATFTVTVRDTKAPVVAISANPNSLLWSPNKTMTPVTVSGKVTDGSLTTAVFSVVDEYGYVKPAGTVTVAADGSYSFVIKLEAWRQGTDANGRLYTITVTATDALGNKGSATVTVLVPHNS